MINYSERSNIFLKEKFTSTPRQLYSTRKARVSSLYKIWRPEEITSVRTEL